MDQDSIAFAQGLLDIVETGDATTATHIMAGLIQGCTGMQLAFVDPGGDFAQGATTNLDDTAQTRLQVEFATPDKNPVIAQMGRIPQSRFMQISDFVDQRTLLDSEFYQEMLQPRGDNRVAMMSMTNAYGAMSFGVEQDPDAEFASMSAAVQVARQISRAFDLRVSCARPSQSAILLDAGGRVLGGSADFVEAASLGTLKCAARDRPVRPASTRMGPEFLSKLDQAVRGRPARLVLPSEEGPCRVHLSPGPSVEQLNVVWVDVGRLHAQHWTVQSIQAVYGLTPREASVALALLEGHDVDSAACELGLAARSVRTYLSAVFAKTHTATQAQLIRALLGG